MKPHNPCKICIVRAACQIPHKPRYILDRPECFEYEVHKVKNQMYNRDRCWPLLYHHEVDDQWLNTGKMFDEQLRLDDDTFVDIVFYYHFKNKNYRNLHLYKEALSCILANLTVCRKEYVPLSKPQVKYHKNKYKWFKDIITNNILEELVRAGFCLHWKGYSGVRNKRSAKYSFRYNFIKRKFNVKIVKTDTLIRMKKRLRKKKGETKAKQICVEPPKNKQYYSMYEDVKTINDLLETATVKFICDFTKYNNPKYQDSLNDLVRAGYLFKNGTEYEINKYNLSVFRSFNRNEYRFGGRFYTQVFGQIPKKIRPTITINGEDTIELDYASHHIRMLYNYLDLDFNGEAYVYVKSDTVNKDKRAIIKYLSLIAINAQTRKGAVYETRKKMKDDSKIGKFNGSIPSYKTIEYLYDNFLNYHKAISKYVCADVGIKLQYQDSCIMNDILLELKRQNIIGLPFHDSIRVQKKHADVLYQLMIDKYYEKMKHHYPIIE